MKILHTISDKAHVIKKYINFISKRNRSTKTKIFFYRHHIIPKSIIKTFCLNIDQSFQNSENITFLSNREHLIAHKILAKIFPSHSIKYAYFRMFKSVDEPHLCVITNSTNEKIYISTKEYKENKHLYNRNYLSRVKVKDINGNIIIVDKNDERYLSGELVYFNKGIKKPQGFSEKLRTINLGKKHSDETKLKLSLINKGKKRQPMTEENKKRLMLCNIGRKASTETKQKLSISHLGYTRTENSKSKQSDYYKSNNLKWINDGVINKRIPEAHIQMFMENGWNTGRCKKYEA